VLDSDDGTPTQAERALQLSLRDWELILSGARTLQCNKGDVVVAEGTEMNCIFQVSTGSCRIEKKQNLQTTVLGRIKNTIFGEISFLEGGAASASVIADKNDTQVKIIEGYFLNILFQYHSELSGRFYHYLCHILSKRLTERERASQKL